jgi:hypothetical protein
MRNTLFPLALGAVVLLSPMAAMAGDPAQTDGEPVRVEGLSAVQLFEIAENAIAESDFDTATALYQIRDLLNPATGEV